MKNYMNWVVCLSLVRMVVVQEALNTTTTTITTTTTTTTTTTVATASPNATSTTTSTSAVPLASTTATAAAAAAVEPLLSATPTAAAGAVEPLATATATAAVEPLTQKLTPGHFRQRLYFSAIRSTSPPSPSPSSVSLPSPSSVSPSFSSSSFFSFYSSSSSSRPSVAPVRIERTIPSTAPPPPYFDPSAPTNMSAQLGTHAYLPCRIRNLGNQSISWIRSRDSHILTVDRYTFIADQRFQAWHEADSETWTLQVMYVQERDTGRYECQVSTEPKMSHFVHFQVVTPLVHIPGGPDMYVKSGSTVTIKCIISGTLHQPKYIFWYQGKERVVADELSGRGRQVLVERVSEDTTVGTLLIPRASPRDQGSYTCAPASLPNASVTLHVLNGEHPAAMYHGGVSRTRPATTALLLSCLLAWWLLAGGGVLVTGTEHPLLLRNPLYLLTPLPR